MKPAGSLRLKKKPKPMVLGFRILFYFILFSKTGTKGSLILKHYAKIETYDIIRKTKYIYIPTQHSLLDVHGTGIYHTWYIPTSNGNT